MIWMKVFYSICFPEDRCEVIKTDENDVATCNDLMEILRHKLECQFQNARTRDSVSIGNFLELLSKYRDAGFLFLAIIKSIMLSHRLSMFFPRIKKLPFSLAEEPLKLANTRNTITCAYLFGGLQ